jgi:mannose-1-phosphate guanylyltransferase/mannose-6-phosphate isomerase
MIQVTPVMFCGGSGTRLWPLSRTGFPKQFLCLTGNESLFQQAAQGLDVFVCHEPLKDLYERMH